MNAKKFTPMAMFLALVLMALPATAERRSKDRGHDVAQLADRLDDATYEVYCDAVNTRHRYGVQRWRALRALHRLDYEARDFHKRVERGIYDRHTRSEFRDLERAFHVAQRHLPALRPSKQLAREFDRIERMMDRLDTRLATRFDRNDRRHHARHDRRAPWLAYNWR